MCCTLVGGMGWSVLLSFRPIPNHTLLAIVPGFVAVILQVWMYVYLELCCIMVITSFW